jgi:hypothetical protein
MRITIMRTGQESQIYVLVDSQGLPMRVVVHSASIQDRDGAGWVLDKILRPFPWLELIYRDGGCNAGQVEVGLAKVPLHARRSSRGATT